MQEYHQLIPFVYLPLFSELWHFLKVESPAMAVKKPPDD